MLSHQNDNLVRLIKGNKHKSFHATDDVGTSLGLYISEKICRSLGGNIHVDSNDRRGAMFIFTMEAEDIESQLLSQDQYIRGAKVIKAPRTDLI